MAASDQVLYVYGIIPGEQSLPDDGALRGVEASGLTAIVEPVPAADFSPEALEERLKSLEWVGGLARRHEAVLEGAMRLGAVVPARLCTLFSHAEALAAALAEGRERLGAALERVRGREEWGVKVYCDETLLGSRVGAEDGEALALAAALAEASPGQAFLLRKKRQARLAKIAGERLGDLLDETLGALEGELDDVPFELLPAPPTGPATAAPGPLVLNLAALVAAARRTAFHSAVEKVSERFADDGLHFAVSGPWPPYSFAAGSGALAGSAGAAEQER